MKKVVILGSAYPLRGGGLATFNERLAKAFCNRGYQVIIYTFSLQYPGFLFPGKTQYSDEPPPDNLDIRVKVNSINPFNWFKVGREIKKLKPDLMVVRYWLPFMAPCLGTISSVVRKNKKTKVVAITDNVIPHEKRPGDHFLTSFFLKRADGFVTMSETVLEDLKKFKTTNKPAWFCEHPLYDNFGETENKEKARQLLNLDIKRPLILFFGFIREYKGLDILLKAMAMPEIKSMGIQLLIAGEFYSSSEKYFKLADDLNLRDAVVWHNDFIPNERVRLYFSAADMVAQPYKSATQSGVTQIAYHFKVPMLVTNVGGLPEMVPHNKVGYVVEPDPEDIGRAIAAFFKEEKADEMIKNISQEKKRFSWNQLVDTIIKII